MSKSRQEAQYAGNPFPKIPENSWTNEFLNEGVAGLNDVFLQMEVYNFRRCQKSAEFSQLIQEKIIKELLEPIKQEVFEFQSNQIKKIIQLNKILQEKQQRVAKKSTKFTQLYHQQVESQNTSKAKKVLQGDLKQRCLFKKMHSFLRSVEDQQELKRQLGKACVSYWVNTLQIEQKRQNTLRESLNRYLEGLSKCYQDEESHSGPQKQMLEKLNAELQESQLYEKVYSVEKIFPEKDIEYFKREMKKEQVLLKDAVAYMEGFIITRFDDRILLMKQMQVQREVGVSKFRETRIVVSVDWFLHCFDLFEE